MKNFKNILLSLSVLLFLSFGNAYSNNIKIATEGA